MARLFAGAELTDVENIVYVQQRLVILWHNENYYL